eukprot:g3047.t1
MQYSRLGATAMHRLQVMTVEDVGIAAPEAVETIAAVRNHYLKALVKAKSAENEQVAEEEAARIVMAAAVYLAKLPKTRASCVLSTFLRGGFECLRTELGDEVAEEIAAAAADRSSGPPPIKAPPTGEKAEDVGVKDASASSIAGAVRARRSKGGASAGATDGAEQDGGSSSSVISDPPPPAEPHLKFLQILRCAKKFEVVMSDKLSRFQSWLRTALPKQAMTSALGLATTTPEELHIEKEFLRREQEIFFIVYSA